MASVRPFCPVLPKVKTFVTLLVFLLCLGFQQTALTVAGSESGELYLTILHTNDEHGAFIPHSAAVDYHPYRENPSIGGYARLATLAGEIRRQKEALDEPVLLLSAGDFFGSTPFNWLAPLGYAPELSLKQAAGYDAVALGNHEFDYGSGFLAAYLRKAGYPAAHDDTIILGSNLSIPEDHALAGADLFQRQALLTLENGFKVGLFSLIGREAADTIQAAAPAVFLDPHETAEHMVSSLREAGAELVIAITHSGLAEDREMAAAVEGIDIIVGGHCHTALYEPVVEKNTVILQAGSLLEYMGRLELAYNPSVGELRIRNYETGAPFLHRLDHGVAADPYMEEKISVYTNLVNDLAAEMTGGSVLDILDPLMLSPFIIPVNPPTEESPLGNFITDAMRLVAAEMTGEKVDFAIQASGSIRGDLVPGTMPHSLGQVSFYDLVSLAGLGVGPDKRAGYPLVKVYLTGEELRRGLEAVILLTELMGEAYFIHFSGLRYHYNPGNAILFNLPLAGTPIPTTRAVISAERYTGEGVQGTSAADYVPIERGDEELYALVTDTYIASFLPLAGELLPSLEIVFKDKQGNPVDQNDLDLMIIRRHGEELKVWQALVYYALAQPAGPAGLPEVDPYYAERAGRINPVNGVEYSTLLGLAVMIPPALLFLAFWIRRRVSRGPTP